MSALFETVNDVIAERDSLATQLEQMRRERDAAVALREDADARAEASAASHASQLARLRDEREALRSTMRTWEMLYEEVIRERDAARSDRDAMAQALGDTRADLAEARATNARLHRRAQGVDARSPDDADLIRRLRADVRGQAKHAGHVAGYVMRLRCALSDAQHARDADARSFNATIDREHARLERVERDLADLRAKLARIRDVAMDRYDTATTACDALRAVLRIIDEKEGGQ